MHYRYHPPTVDSLDITPSDDGLAVRVGIFNTTDSGSYASIEVMNRDLEDVIAALRAAAASTPPEDRGMTSPDPTEWVGVAETYVVKGINGEEWVGTATSVAHAASIARSAKPGISAVSIYRRAFTTP